jgi:hypothetical protein
MFGISLDDRYLFSFQIGFCAAEIKNKKSCAISCIIKICGVLLQAQK